MYPISIYPPFYLCFEIANEKREKKEIERGSKKGGQASAPF
jgi:hypothetical protein